MLASSTTRLTCRRARAPRCAPATLAAECSQQRVGERREVGIVGAEQLLGRHRLQDLHQRAVRAEGDVQRVARLLPLDELAGVEQAVRQRHVRRATGTRRGSVAAAGAAVGVGAVGHAAESSTASRGGGPVAGRRASAACHRARRPFCSSRMRFRRMNFELRNSSALVPCWQIGLVDLLDALAHGPLRLKCGQARADLVAVDAIVAGVGAGVAGEGHLGVRDDLARPSPRPRGRDSSRRCCRR